jgi:hypothetical protein
MTGKPIKHMSKEKIVMYIEMLKRDDRLGLEHVMMEMMNAQTLRNMSIIP